MKTFTINQALSLKVLTTLTLCSLLMSALPVGIFNARAEDEPAVLENESVVTPEETIVDEDTETDHDTPLFSFSRIQLPKPEKVKICHATESESNPFETLSFFPAVLTLNGHLTHSDDIIPPFARLILADFPGQNWDDEGQAIWNNDCEVPKPPTVTSCEVFGSVKTTDLSTWDLSQTRVNGHNQLVTGGLRIYTDTDAAGSPDPRKAAGYYTTSFPLSDLGSQTIDQALTYTVTTGIEPGLQLVTDFDNNGTPDGILVGEAVYGNAWWLSDSAAAFVKTNAPNTGGGYGSNWYGTPNEWLTKFPNAKVLAIGYSLGSGVNGGGVIKEINLGCVKYTFDEPTKEPAQLKVHILKYLQNGEVTAQIPDASSIPSFPMTATWNAANLGGGGTGTYVLGNTHGGSPFRYGADTSFMSVPADYTTSEITGGDSPVLPIKAECSEGKYRLVGYKEGDTLGAAQVAPITVSAPVYTGLTSDKTIIVVNEKCGNVVEPPKPVCKIGENLLQNGSFEKPTVTDHSGQWEIFSTVANWVISLSDGLELWKNFNGTGAGLASEGIQNAELDGNDATKITQAVTTIPGATYELTFDFSPRAGVTTANNKMDALVGGNAVLSLSADGSTTTTNTWRPQTYSFTATSTSTTIGFEDKGIADANGGYGPLLDNAALCLTKMPDPEPACTLTIKSDATDFVPEKNAVAKVLTGPLHSSWVTSIPSSIASWIWGDDPVVGGVLAETQTFKKSFNWTGGTVTGATLKIASDNSHDITLGSFSGGDATEVNYTGVKSYDVSSGVVAGMNTLSIEVENFPQVGGNPATNPAGLLYDLTITGTGKSCGEVIPEVPKTTGDVTMCKVDEENIPQTGWTLTLLGNKIEDVTVPANTGAGQNTTTILDANKSYVALASGTWNNNRTPLNTVDAEYSTETAWATHMDGFDGYGVDILELSINNVLTGTQDWGPYSSLHTYAKIFTQVSTGTANFSIADSYHGDNTGSLNVALYKGYTGVTGENGCVTFKNVPFGTYTAGEVMQDGWEAVSGSGSVDIGYKEPTITIKNARIIPDEELPPTHTISGVKWNDIDGDGMKDDGEPNLSGWGIRAVKGDTTLYATTSETGAYSFVVTEGTWTISEMGKSGWTQTGLYQNGDKITLGTETSRSCSITAATPLSFSRSAAAPTSMQYTYSCDFGNHQNPEVIVPVPVVTGGSSGGSSRSRSHPKSTQPQGQVLGASTSTPACTVYLTDYMKKGNAANSTQVTKLQIFLNAVGIKIPVSGLFDGATDQAVRAFQLQHKAEVLTPWFTAHIVPHENPTGWVYQLTRWKINNIVCPGSEAYPVLN